MAASPHVRNIAIDMILSIITVGIYNVYIQHKQMKALNQILGYERYSFFWWAILTLITFGLYHIYHEVRMSLDISAKTGRNQEVLPILTIVLSVIALTFIVDAIQQYEINHHYGVDDLF